MRRSCSPNNSSFRHFNPRTHVGCDLRRRIIRLDSINFNPRTHVWCDQAAGREDSGVHISIHAPTWGATQIIPCSGKAVKFQSTHPRGVRLVSLSLHSLTENFNPRTHVGCDLHSQLGNLRQIEFQSTHPRGVRLLLNLPADSIHEFQSTHPRGVRQYSQKDFYYFSKFQSTHPRGVRP